MPISPDTNMFRRPDSDTYYKGDRSYIEPDSSDHMDIPVRVREKVLQDMMAMSCILEKHSFRNVDYYNYRDEKGDWPSE